MAIAAAAQLFKGLEKVLTAIKLPTINADNPKYSFELSGLQLSGLKCPEDKVQQQKFSFPPDFLTIDRWK